ncbi:hypothetical protein [Sporichthya sp.]|uniref:hypothetical protein n=1 Tax=Sporichthya sp. TaxID=65475 RepID=UPI00181651D0|nr:hypothetical protein [Sporichthya sp.]MBA3743455.1 hypothetical protein [Sporichthya sp.]
MRLVAVLTTGALALGALSACSDSEPNVNGDAPPSIGPTVAQVTPPPAKARKHKKKAKPVVTPEPSVSPTPQPEPTLPPGEEFDPEHYDPEGDHDPESAQTPPGFPAG